MQLKQGKEEITYLLTKVIQKFESTHNTKIKTTTNPSNFLPIAEELTTVNELLFERGIYASLKTSKKRDHFISVSGVRNGFLGLTNHPNVFLVNSCYFYVYGVTRNEFQNNPLDIYLVQFDDANDRDTEFHQFIEGLKVVLVGTSGFNDKAFGNIPGLDREIMDFRSCLSDRKLIGVSDPNISILLNSTNTEVYAHLHELTRDVNNEEAILFYYVGHGLLGPQNEVYLATEETDSKNPENKAINLANILGFLSDSRAKARIIILDCDFSNAAAAQRALDNRLKGNGGNFALLTSTIPRTLQHTARGSILWDSLTAKIISLIRGGGNEKQKYLTFEDIYSYLIRKNTQKNESHLLFFSNIGFPIPFANNIKYRPDSMGAGYSSNNDLNTKDKSTLNATEEENTNLKILENKLHSDEYSLNDEDILGYDLHAFNLFNIMKDKQTNPPLNIGILAPWGRGKTTLMRKIESLFIEERGFRISGQLNPAVEKPTVSDLKSWLNGGGILSEKKIPYATVWFNPWNYQSSDLIWAGMANAVIEQVVDQMDDPIAKQSFWFRLRLARIDHEELRKELQIRSTLFIVQFIIWGITIVLSTILFFLNKTTAVSLLGIGSFFGIFSSVASLLKPNKKDITEMFDRYTKAPQYLNKLGTFHDVQQDLKKVFDLLINENEPLVIFIDDLDRCSPSKIVEVVEAINVFISGDYRKKTYFVLGMDAEIISASLDVAYEKMKGKIVNRETEQGSLGWYFLDKFIQLPFFIPVMNESKKTDYLEWLFRSDMHTSGETNDTKGSVSGIIAESEDAGLLAEKILATKSVNETKQILNSLDSTQENAVEKEILKRQLDQPANGQEIAAEIVKYACYISSDPRSLKRFANLMRFYNGYQVLRMKKGQDYVPINFLGKYITIMLKFPQLVRWIQWDTESKTGIHTSASSKAQLIDNSVGELTHFKYQKAQIAAWIGGAGLADSKNTKFTHLKAVIEMQNEFPWLKSDDLINILLSTGSDDATLLKALQCNIW